MKKLLLLTITFIMIIPLLVNAKNCDTDKISINSITIDSKSDNVSEINQATSNGKNINLNISMSKVEDSIRYKIIIRNDSNEDYNLDRNDFKTKSKYIEYELEIENNSYKIKADSSKTIYLKIIYKSEIPKDSFKSGKYNYKEDITLNLSKKTILNPKTTFQAYILLFITIIIMSCSAYLLLNKKKYHSLLIFIISIILLPINIYAVCKTNIKIESNITINQNTKPTATDTIKNLVDEADPTSTDVITLDTTSDSCTNTLAYDGTSDNNLRYVGKNPCNYVTFNDETWRIIGVMNNIDDGTGNKETRLKIIRYESIGNFSWDSSTSDINSGKGVNDWSKSDLMKELNGDYLNYNLNENTYWYNGSNNKKTAVYNYNNGLKLSAQKLISNAKWYLGGMTSNGYYSSHQDGIGKASYSYTSERGTDVWGSKSDQICNDGACPRATSWIGKIALLYPSDYGFAVGETKRSLCLNTNLDVFQNDNCSSNTWLWKMSGEQWILSTSSIRPHVGYQIHSNGGGDDNGNIIPHHHEGVSDGFTDVYPVVHLDAKVIITNGNGTIDNPYELTIE